MSPILSLIKMVFLSIGVYMYQSNYYIAIGYWRLFRFVLFTTSISPFRSQSTIFPSLCAFNKRASNFICRFVLDDIQCKPVCNHTQWANIRVELYNLCDHCSRLGCLNLLIDDCVNNNYWNFVRIGFVLVETLRYQDGTF